MLMDELITQLRNIIGDTDLVEPNMSDEELTTILDNSARTYSRIKNILKRIEVPYDKTEEFYDLPTDAYKAKSVLLIEQNYEVDFINNLTQVILEELPDVDLGTLRITYSRYFKAEEIDDREIDIYFLYAEALCYKLMASKSADWIKFSTGEKMVDESLVSQKYLKLFVEAEKRFKRAAIKAFGKRVNNYLVNLDYDLPYPPLGETP